MLYIRFSLVFSNKGFRTRIQQVTILNLQVIITQSIRLVLIVNENVANLFLRSTVFPRTRLRPVDHL